MFEHIAHISKVCYLRNLRAVFMKQQVAHGTCDSKVPWIILLPALVTCAAKWCFCNVHSCIITSTNWCWRPWRLNCNVFLRAMKKKLLTYCWIFLLTFLLWSLYVPLCRWTPKGTSFNVWLHLRHCRTAFIFLIFSTKFLCLENVTSRLSVLSLL